MRQGLLGMNWTAQLSRSRSNSRAGWLISASCPGAIGLARDARPRNGVVKP